MYGEVSFGAAQERGEEQGCKYAEDNEEKGDEKMMMTKKGHENFRRKNSKPLRRVTELRHFFNRTLTTAPSWIGDTSTCNSTRWLELSSKFAQFAGLTS